MEINLSLLSHIILDSESQSRFGIEGNHFTNTFGYLLDYLYSSEGKAAIAPTEQDNITTLQSMMKDLALINESLKSRDIDDISSEICQRIQSSEHGSQLLPGGWHNIQEMGHAMIYQFERTSEEKLLFHIYNSGAGTEYHQKLSTPDKETFVPQKTYEIPANFNPLALKNFITSLLANLICRHPSRASPYINEKLLYKDIASRMQMLNAEEKLREFAPESIEHATTAGQLSGTCSQRSIHQLLKLHFKDKKNYQRFIFLFKMHALQDFLKKPPPIYSPQVGKFLLKAINHNARILKKLNSEDLQRYALELEEAKRIIQERTHLKHLPKATAHMTKAQSLSSFASGISESQEPQSVIEIKPWPKKTYSNAVSITKKPPDFKPVDVFEGSKVSAKKLQSCIMQLINNSDNLSYKYHQLNLLIQNLPFPSPDDAYEEHELPFLLNHIKFLINSYQDLHSLKFKSATTPKQLINLLSLLCIYLHIYQRLYPDSENILYIKKSIYTLMSKMEDSALGASFDPELDDRLLKIKTFFPSDMPGLKMFEEEKDSSLKAFRNICTRPEITELANQKFDPSNPGHQKAKTEKLLELMVVKDEFMSFPGDIITEEDCIHLTRFEEIQEQSLRNCFVKIHDTFYWVPAFGEASVIDINVQHFSTRYRILKSDSPLLQERYRDFFIHFQEQLDLESSTYQCLRPGLEKEGIFIDRGDIIKWNESLSTFESSSPLSNINYFKESYVAQSLSISSLPFISALNPEFNYLGYAFKNTIDSHEVQLKCTKNPTKPSYEQILLERELFHLRTNIDSSATLSLAYFSEHFEQLSSPEIQNYLEVNLFQNPRKIQITQFENFIQEAIAFHLDSQAKNTKTSIYLICLKAKVYHYLNPQKALEWIEAHLLTETNIEFKAILHAQRFKILIDKKHRTEEENQNLFSSYLWVKNRFIPEEHETIIETSQLDEACLRYFVQDKQLRPEQIQTLCQSFFNFDQEKFDMIWEQDTENFLILPKETPEERLTFDIHQGQVFASKGILSPIPSYLSQHPLFQELKLNPLSLIFKNHAGNFFELENPAIRFYLDRNNNAICQQKIDGIWHTRIPLTIEEEKRLCFANSCTHLSEMPKILTDADASLWFDETTRTAKLFRKQEKIFDVTPEGKLVGLRQVPLIFESFEDKKFIIGNKDTYHFTRYGFSVADEMIIGTNLKITSSMDLLPSNTAQMYCKNELTGQMFCRIPIQAFYYDTTQTPLMGHLPTFTHDISNVIPGKIFEQQKPLARYANTQEFYQIPIIDGQIRPQNSEMALYLCYIHLANHDYEKAWELLQTIDILGLNGTEKELQFLEWITNKIPYPLPKQKNESPENPEMIACQMKAMSIYTQFLNQGLKTPEHKKSPNINPLEEQELYHFQLRSDVENFRKKLSSELINKIKKYQNMLRHTPIEFQLSDSELLSMTRYLHSEQTSFDGAISYLHQSLQLKKIQQEIKHLQSLPQTLENQKKLEQLQIQLTQEQQIRQRVTRLKPMEVSLDLANLKYLYLLTDITTSLGNYNLWRNEDLLTLPAEYDEAMQMLNGEMNLSLLVDNFPAYAQIAYNKEHPDHPKLHEFLTRYIRSQYHTPLEQQKNAFLAWCIFLYRVAETPTEKLPKKLLVNDFYETSKSIPITPISVMVAQDEFIETTVESLALIEVSSRKPNASLGDIHILIPDNLSFDSLRKTPEIDKIMSTIHRANEDLTAVRKHAATENDAGEGLLIYRDTLNGIHFSEEQCAILNSKNQTLIQNIDLALQEWQTKIKSANELLKQFQGLDILAGLRKPITQDDLIRCYYQNDLTAYHELFGDKVDDEVIEDLRQSTHRLLLLEVSKQQAIRLDKALSQSDNLSIASILSEENLAPHDPALMVFQYKSQILLRPQQIRALNILLDNSESTPETIQKITMGGGKSKVLLPALAQKKATGDRLVIIEVPKALLESNFRDLNQTSQELFSQKAIRFDFNRKSDCSAKRLENIYYLLHDCMIQKNYLVTNGESIASLELKYLELLSITPDPELQDEWEQQIYWSGKTLDLIRTQAEAIIDEAHQALWLKKQLNYTLGDKTTLDDRLITESLKCYEFLSHPKRHIEDLLHHEESPLQAIIARYPPALQTRIREFMNKNASIDGQEISEDDKVSLAIYRAQMELIPQTIKKNYREHYGPSKSLSKTPIERCVAIPYSANEKPSEQSEFAQSLETINYTIQSVIQDGLNPEVIKNLFEDFLSEARGSILQSQGQYTEINHTPIGMNINRLLPEGFNLGMIQTSNPKHIQELHQHLSHHPQFIKIALQEKILPLISAEQTILQSDCYQHIDLYHRVQGVSGTPWNAKTYHHRLHYDPKNAIGADGFIQQRLIEKNTLIKQLPEKISMARIFGEHPNPRLRAIIDVGAIFKGMDNLTVAQELKKQTDTNIKYILFYDEHDRLCALSKENDNIILIGKTDPSTIREKLACEPHEYFTYYDQAHTVGADILQFDEAHAICLVNEDTPLQAFLQASMRMRQLGKNQSIEIQVPKTLESESLPDLFKYFEIQQEKSLEDDYLFAAIKQMKNTIRQALMRDIRSKDSPEEQQAYFKRYQEFFIQEPIVDIYQRYSSIETQQNTLDFLNQYQMELIQKYTTLSQQLPPERIFEELETIKENYLPLCPPTIKKTNIEKSLEVEVEQEQELQVEQEIQREQYLELEDSSLKAKAFEYWQNEEALPLNTYLPEEMHVFDENFKCSPNYIQSYENQTSFLNAYLKPVHSILMGINSSGQLEAILLSEKDIINKKNCLYGQWIISADGSVLHGNIPSLSAEQSISYQKLIEQAQYFGGYTQKLLSQTSPLVWLSDQAQKKLSLFQKYLADIRGYSKSNLQLLKSLFSEKPRLMAYLTQHQFSDITQIDWMSQFKDLSAKQARELKLFCSRLHQLHLKYITQNSIRNKKGEEALIHEFPLMGSWLQDHFKILQKMRMIVDSILQNPSYILLAEEKDFLERHLGGPIDILETENILSHKLQCLEKLQEKNPLLFASTHQSTIQFTPSDLDFQDFISSRKLSSKEYEAAFFHLYHHLTSEQQIQLFKNLIEQPHISRKLQDYLIREDIIFLTAAQDESEEIFKDISSQNLQLFLEMTQSDLNENRFFLKIKYFRGEMSSDEKNAYYETLERIEFHNIMLKSPRIDMDLVLWALSKPALKEDFRMLIADDKFIEKPNFKDFLLNEDILRQLIDDRLLLSRMTFKSKIISLISQLKDPELLNTLYENIFMPDDKIILEFSTFEKLTSSTAIINFIDNAARTKDQTCFQQISEYYSKNLTEMPAVFIKNKLRKQEYMPPSMMHMIINMLIDPANEQIFDAIDYGLTIRAISYSPEMHQHIQFLTKKSNPYLIHFAKKYIENVSHSAFNSFLMEQNDPEIFWKLYHVRLTEIADLEHSSFDYSHFLEYQEVLMQLPEDAKQDVIRLCQRIIEKTPDFGHLQFSIFSAKDSHPLEGLIKALQIKDIPTP